MIQSKFDLIDTFSRRPTLSPLASAALRVELKAQYPLVSIDPDVAVIQPVDADSHASGQTLSAHLRTRVGTGRTLQWTNAGQVLVTDPRQTDPPTPQIDVERLAVLIDSVALGLPGQYMKALVDFWSQADQGGASPWQQLARALEGQQGSASQSADHPQPDAGAERFERQALGVLASQLAQIRDLQTLDMQEFDEIERYLAKVTDIAPLLTDQASADAVSGVSLLDPWPTWLRTASSADRLDYSRRMTGLAVVCARAAGKSWNDDLPPIVEYARKALQDALRDDHPQETLLSLDDVTVHIARVTASPVPSTGQIIAVGSVEKVQMSVAEFALGNLSSLPSGTITLSTRNAWPLPLWLTADYLKQLVVRTDIGTAYPALVRRCLITDQKEVARRRVLFSDQLRIQLPLKALEQKIREQGGVTQAGYRQVCALLETAQTKGLATVLRPLAWRAEPGAKADIVSNMFVIGATDTQVGPVLLYRPFAQVSFTEYPSWRALREAIAKAGNLQDEVLAWMTGPGRRRYANGGFDEPHVIRFGLGSDFAPLQIPAPAELADDIAQGDVTTLLFDANARALADLADRESVSNTESRWAMFQQGGWLILDAVMPFISGAVGSALWLMQVMMAVDRVLVAQTRKTSREGVEAWNNLLLTVSMVVLHQGFAPATAIRRGAESGTTALEEHLPGTRPEAGSPSSSPAMIDAAQYQLLDFSWSSARQQLNEAQVLELARLKVSSVPELPEPSVEPGREGLYRLNQKWLAKLDSGVYEVDFADDSVFIVDPKQPSIRGPRLRQGDHGWVLDLSLGLRGGGPKRNLRQIAEQNAATLKRVNERTAVLEHSEVRIYQKFADWDGSVRRQPTKVTDEFLDAVEAAAKELCVIVEEKNELQQSLRPVDRAGDKVTGAELQGLVRRISFLERGLAYASTTAAGARVDELRASGGGVATAQNVDTYLQLFEDLLKLQERGVHWAQLRRRYWDTLRNVPKVGEAYWREEVLAFERTNSFTSLEWRAYRMWSLLELSFTNTDILSGLGDKALKALRTDEPLHAAVSSHAELEKPNDYSLAEQIGVLESALREYRRAALIATDALERPVNPLNEPRFKRFVEELSWITEYAEKHLSDLIRESAEPSQQPREYTPKVKQPHKRVFKTRGQRTLVGRLTDGEPGMPGEVIEVTQRTSEKVIGTYHLHDNGEWVEVKTPSPAGPVEKEPTLSRVELSRQASAALDRLEADISSAVGHSKRSGEPADIEDLLIRKADALTGLADRLSARPGAGRPGEAAASTEQALVGRLRQGAARLVAQGRTLRIAMIKAQPPTGARLSYLAAEREVSIARFGQRKNMSGGKRDDFLQEYVIRDKDSKALWWAHFHYASEDAAAAAFTAAHLKIPSQRLVGYKAQVKAAKDNQEVISIYRATIGKDVAQRLFLVLEPNAQTAQS